MCENTRWSHLLVAGGWYDQHPDFVQACQTYFGLKGKHEEKTRKDEERKRETEMRSAKTRRR